MCDDKKLQALEQYKLILNTKEQYTERNFLTNRFYLVFIVALIVILSTFENIYFGTFITTRGALTFLGMCITILWWCNVDTYNILISIKFKNIIDVMEEDFPFPVHKLEKQKLDELRTQKKAFIFADTQKLMAVVFFVIFMMIFLTEVVSTVHFKKFIELQNAEPDEVTVSKSIENLYQYYPENQVNMLKTKLQEKNAKKETENTVKKPVTPQ